MERQTGNGRCVSALRVVGIMTACLQRPAIIRDARIASCRPAGIETAARAMIRASLALLMAFAWGGASHAMDREHQRANTMLETMCGRCHAVGATGQSQHRDAPPFRTFGENKVYDSDFGQRLQDGLSTIHRDMPTFKFSRGDADAAVAYLRSIQRSGRSKP